MHDPTLISIWQKFSFSRKRKTAGKGFCQALDQGRGRQAPGPELSADDVAWKL